MLTPDFTAYRDVQQAINLGMMREFAAIGVEFAVSSRTVMQTSEAGLAVSMAQASSVRAPGGAEPSLGA